MGSGRDKTGIDFEAAVVRKKHATAGRLLVVVGVLLVLAAVGLVAFNMHESNRAQIASSQVKEQLIAAMGKTSSNVARPSSAGSGASPVLGSSAADMPTVEIDGREYLGVLRIPSLGLELPVLADWSYDGLFVAPCRYVGSAYAGNMVIAAHNYTSHFGGLLGLEYGAEVTFADVLGTVFAYRVASVEELDPYDIEGMTQSEWPLTLFTCTLGGANRVTVRCEEVGL